MLLKIVAVVYGLWFVQAALEPGFYDTPSHMASSTLALGGLLALFDHAFRMGWLSANIWRTVALVYVADGLVHVVPSAEALIEAQRFEVLAGAAAISFVFQLPMLFSLWRLSFPSTRSDQTGLARMAMR